MKSVLRTVLVAGSLAVMASPAIALPSQVPSTSGTSRMPANQGTANAPSGTVGGSNNPGSPNRASAPGPKASLPAKARAYGRYCQTDSRKRVAGTPGTPFSRCVTAMAKLAKEATKNPRAACRDESRKPVAGTPGTPFSKCVSGGAKLLRDEADQTDNDPAETSASPSR